MQSVILPVIYLCLYVGRSSFGRMQRVTVIWILIKHSISFRDVLQMISTLYANWKSIKSS